VSCECGRACVWESVECTLAVVSVLYCGEVGVFWSRCCMWLRFLLARHALTCATFHAYFHTFRMRTLSISNVHNPISHKIIFTHTYNVYPCTPLFSTTRCTLLAPMHMHTPHTLTHTHHHHTHTHTLSLSHTYIHSLTHPTLHTYVHTVVRRTRCRNRASGGWVLPVGGEHCDMHLFGCFAAGAKSTCAPP
jgi:hypothetical protein